MDQATCGCDCHELEPHDPNIVTLNGKQWNAICALRENLRLLAKARRNNINLQKKIKSIESSDHEHQKLIKDLETLVCPHCFKIVGSSWVIHDGSIICEDCMSFIFPHF